ncbi:hypothetical protein NDU88_007865 [Pleurodeles waltl]|uniref:Uncharacterized protein n=1 Tax=Pleurodeles waltl TaxID=8319 RepID=A0AAV7VVL9_PLEWA|nr:hypothetical protein NDU88_007865 [Pleurodeles waltl]
MQWISIKSALSQRRIRGVPFRPGGMPVDRLGEHVEAMRRLCVLCSRGPCTLTVYCHASPPFPREPTLDAAISACGLSNANGSSHSGAVHNRLSQLTAVGMRLLIFT